MNDTHAGAGDAGHHHGDDSHHGPGHGHAARAGHGEHGHSEQEHAGHQHADDEGLDDLLDLDAEVLSGYWATALDWVRDAAAPRSPGQILDLGAGTGTGALGLALRFPAATVTAVDISADALRRLDGKAAGLGLGAQVRTVEADLDAGWPDLGALDLIWASMSLHHLADPGAALRDVLAATKPGGMIAVAEFPEPLRFLDAAPDADARGHAAAGFEDRVLAWLNAAHTEQLPTLGSAWAPRLTDAGWRVITEREFAIDLKAPEHPRAADYARAWFARLSHRMEDQLEPADRATLRALLDEHGPAALLQQNLHIRGIRTVTLASRD
jgi:SAM-dependent methyltransferase